MPLPRPLAAVGGPISRIFKMTLRLVCFTSLAFTTLAFAEPALPLTQNDVVVFTGGTEIVRLQRAGHLETLLTNRFKHALPRFRDLAWDADTVFFQGTVDGQWRKKGHFDDLQAFGDWETQLKRVEATVIIAQFGTMESLAGPEGLQEFIGAYNRLLDDFVTVTQRIILISPAPFEASLRAHNENLALYIDATRQLAIERQCTFVDLAQTPVPQRTNNGWQTKADRMPEIQSAIAEQLGLDAHHLTGLEPLRLAVVEKHRLWIDYWRPANWKCLFGDDGKRGFSKAAGGLPSFQEEWSTFPSLIAKAEAQIQAIAHGQHVKHWAPLPPKPRTGSPDADIIAETAAITVPEGYRINLFADESLGIVNPLGIRWDPKGRLYVACTNVYPQIDPGAQPDDFIVVLEDSNGDGKADKSTRFAEGLNIPTGIELGNHGVYVGQNTEVLFLKDTDGDLRADERSVLLSGFGNGDSHQTINAFVWSPGGELFFSQGDGIESRVETPWGVSGVYGPGAFRYSPHRLQLHGMLNNFMGPGNPWGIAFDDWGQAFIIDGAGGISHLTPAFLPVKRKLKLPRIGDPGGYCGIDVLASDRFPADMRHDFVIGDYKKNQVTRFSTIPDGAGFRVKFESPLIKSSHRNFRPVDVRVGPDAGVYVADFYNPIICHQDDFYRIPIRDKTHGRIWRMAPEGTPFTTPALVNSDIAILLEKLKSKDRWTRYQAKRLLALKKTDTVATAALAWLPSLTDDQGFAKLEVLRLLETIEYPIQGTSSLLETLLVHQDARIRAYATRVVGRWADRLDTPLALLRLRLTDADARVRMEAALACGMVQDPAAIKALATLTDLPMDRWVEYAFKQAVEALKPTWLKRFEHGDQIFDRPAHLAAVLNGSSVKSLIDRERALVRNNELPLAERRKRLVALIAQGESKDIILSLHPDFVEATFPEVARMTRENVIDRNHPKKARQALGGFLSHKHPAIQRAALELAALWEVHSLRQPILRIAKEDSTNTTTAIATLGALGGEAPMAFLRSLAISPNPPARRAQAIEALCRHQKKEAARFAAQLLSEPVTFDPKHLLGTIIKHKNCVTHLNEELNTLTISPKSAVQTIEALVALGSNQAELRAHFDAAAGIDRKVLEYSGSTIAQLAKEVAEFGNPNKGEDVFRQASMNCYACHQIHGAGGRIGPDLTNIGNIVPVERLIEETIWPQRQVKEGYNLVQLVHNNGEIFSGYLDKSADQSHFLLRDPGSQKVLQLNAADIKDQQLLGSAMPAGLVGSLTRPQLRDLISFLKHQGTNQSRNDGRVIRAWEITQDGQNWLPYQSRVSGELRAEDLSPYAKDGSVTLRAADGSSIEGHDSRHLVLKLDSLRARFQAERKLE